MSRTPRRNRSNAWTAIGALASLLALGTLGCAAEPIPYEPVGDMQQLMLTVVEPASEVYWDSVGTIMDRDEGTYEIRPRSDEEWERVRNAAMVIAESGNLLMLPGRVQGEEWLRSSQELIEIGRIALAAAEQKDPEAVFDAGGELYLVCTRCHEAFAPQTLRPNFVQDD